MIISLLLRVLNKLNVKPITIVDRYFRAMPHFNRLINKSYAMYKDVNSTLSKSRMFALLDNISILRS